MLALDAEDIDREACSLSPIEEVPNETLADKNDDEVAVDVVGLIATHLAPIPLPL